MSHTPSVWPRGVPAVGAVAERARKVGKGDIKLFTAISSDRNPVHYDLALTEKTRFGEIVVQGGINTAILNAVVAEDLPGPGTVFLHVDWSFKAPVRPGDTITGRVEVLEAREDKPITKLKTTVTRDDGTVAVEGTALCYTMPLPKSAPRAPTLIDEFDDDGKFFFLDGPAKKRGEERSKKKLCFTSVDREAVAEILHGLAQRDDCWYVKLDREPGRSGLIRGRCFFTSDKAAGEAWRHYRVGDFALCSIQDDDFTDAYR